MNKVKSSSQRPGHQKSDPTLDQVKEAIKNGVTWRSKLFLQILCLFVASTSNAQEMNAGLDAYTNGDYAVALAELTPHAINGEPLASEIVGFLSYAGIGTEQNYRDAAFWFLQAMRYRPDEGHILLGMMYYLGQGVEQDFNMAARYLKIPAEAGDETALFIMSALRSNCTELRVNQFDCKLARQHDIELEQRIETLERLLYERE